MLSANPWWLLVTQMLKGEVPQGISSITNLVLVGFQSIGLCLKFCNLLFSSERCTSTSPPGFLDVEVF